MKKLNTRLGIILITISLSELAYSIYLAKTNQISGLHLMLNVLLIILPVLSIGIIFICKRESKPKPPIIVEDRAEKRFRNRVNSGLTGKDLTDGLYD